jgi:hypothetical protein
LTPAAHQRQRGTAERVPKPAQEKPCASGRTAQCAIWVDGARPMGQYRPVMWPDALTVEEHDYTCKALSVLREEPWAARLVREGEPLLRPLSSDSRRQAKMGILFELRYAYELHRAGCCIDYEHRTGVGHSTVDFRVRSEREWLIEIVSVRVSDALRDASFRYGDFGGFVLSTGAGRQSEEEELVRIQGKIAGKAVKFPPPSNVLHMIVVDVRGLQCSDEGDYAEIAYGWRGLTLEYRPELVHLVGGEPVRGVFEPSNPIRGVATIQNRIHAVCFVHERRYREGEIAENARYCPNPHLLQDAEVDKGIAPFPLGAHVIGPPGR